MLDLNFDKAARFKHNALTCNKHACVVMLEPDTFLLIQIELEVWLLTGSQCLFSNVKSSRLVFLKG